MQSRGDITTGIEIEDETEARTGDETVPRTNAMTIGMNDVMKTHTAQADEIARDQDTVHENGMMAGIIAGRVVTEIIGAGERIPAIGLGDAGTTLLTQGAILDVTTAEIARRTRAPA